MTIIVFTLQIVVLAIIAGTLFLRGTFDTSTIRGGSLYLGLLFFSIVHLMFSSYAEQTLMVRLQPESFVITQRSRFQLSGHCCTAGCSLLPLCCQSQTDFCQRCQIWGLPGGQQQPNSGKICQQLGCVDLT